MALTRPKGSTSINDISSGIYSATGNVVGSAVSGVDLKTINGVSIIGSGNIITKDITDKTGILMGNGAGIFPATADVDYVTLSGMNAAIALATAGANTTWTICNASINAVNGSKYFVDTSLTSITLTLPSSPALNYTITVNDLAGTFNLNNCILARNSTLIMGVPEDMYLNVKNVSVTLVYSGNTYGWKLV